MQNIEEILHEERDKPILIVKKDFSVSMIEVDDVYFLEKEITYTDIDKNAINAKKSDDAGVWLIERMKINEIKFIVTNNELQEIINKIELIKTKNRERE